VHVWVLVEAIVCVGHFEHKQHIAGCQYSFEWNNEVLLIPGILSWREITRFPSKKKN